ncbi:TadE/TadG family type IV pilus assembly protein [Nocardioides sp. R-C-SC26]|uniref:TadE/TadG family type IV pilus assembly protein n=1 Tax=Nocardioides sp. R-C-SC26 TaxID=2870414 RepID=UPI001E444C6F|nr:hypothetical protein [Nocardioides sp. R-C-SC26]
MSRASRRFRDERGSALLELVAVGFVLILPLLWLVVAIFEVQGGSFGTTTAARSAARAYALAPDDPSGRRAALAAARQALRDQGRDEAVRVRVTCRPFPGDCHRGTSVVTVRVETRVVLPLMPDVLGSSRPSFALDATHTVPIGQYVEGP